MHAACGIRLLQATSPLKSSIRAKSNDFTNVRRGVFTVLFSKQNLLLTNTFTSGAFLFLGDLVQQEHEYRSNYIPQRYDWARSARMFTVGLLLGPFHHYYYLYLDKILPNSDLRTVTKKIMADQFFASPATILGFYLGMGYLENKTTAQTVDEISYKFKYTYMGDWLFWPPVQFINFYFLSTKYRVFYINGATMLFNIFLSYIKHFDQHHARSHDN